MRVIGSGFGRTGTLSMKKALEILGFAPCYHMEEVFKSRQQTRYWTEIINDRPVDWSEMFQSFAATVDYPASIYYQELLAIFPDARVVHTVRDPQRWYDSTYETIYQADNLFPHWLQRLVPHVGRWHAVQEQLIWQGLFKGRFDRRAEAIAIFEAYTEAVRQTVPPEQLLVFNVKEGWEPLCKFLEVPVPAVPFPHVNDRAVMKRRFRIVQLANRLGPIVLLGIAAAAIYLLLG